jgi:hypothetical protein
MASMESALAAIESLKPGERFSYAQIAEQYGVSRTTLSRRHRGVQGSKKAQYANQQLLKPQQEDELIKYINKQSEKGLVASRQMIEDFAREIAQKEPGAKWVSRFQRRRQSKLMSAYTTGSDISHKEDEPTFKYSQYFNLLRRKLDEYKVQPEDIYNVDETGFFIGIASESKRIFSKESHEIGSPKPHLHDINCERITAIACICADGSKLPPGLIYQSAASKIQDTWLQDFDSEDHNCFFTSSPSGWTNDDVCLAWLRDVFDRETKPKARGRWRLLFVDGYGSYVTMKFLDYCEENKILLATYPPHSTYTLQPLNVGIFSPLSKAYDDEVETFLHASQGLNTITKREFFGLFWKAWNKAVSPANIEDSWRATGLVPWNPDVILARFKEAATHKPSPIKSTQSILRGGDWRKIERLLKQAVADVHDKNTEKLSLTIHHLSTENIMLKARCKDLENALAIEKKRQQREKSPIFQSQTPESGNTVFYSPRKTQQARDLQKEKDKAIQQAEAAKEKAKLRGQQEKEEKQQNAKKRKRIKASGRQIRLQEEEKKRQREHQKETRIAEESEIQLQDDIGTAKERKPKSPAASKRPKRQNPPPQTSEAIPKGTTAISRRGRQIRLPHRFREP